MSFQKLGDRFLSLADRFPRLWHALVPLTPNNLPPDVKTCGPLGGVVSAIAGRTNLEPLVTEVWEVIPGQPAMHLFYGQEDDAEGLRFLDALSAEALEELPESAEIAEEGRKVCCPPKYAWPVLLYRLGEVPGSPIEIGRFSWLEWNDRHGRRQSQCFPTDSPAIEKNLRGLGQKGDLIFRVDYLELRKSIWRASADAIEHLATVRGTDGGAAQLAKSKSGPRWDKATEARNKWLYEQCKKGTPYKQIIAKLREKPKSWGRISTVQGIKKAALAYADRHGLEPPPPRKGGRPSRKR